MGEKRCRAHLRKKAAWKYEWGPSLALGSLSLVKVQQRETHTHTQNTAQNTVQLTDLLAKEEKPSCNGYMLYFPDSCTDLFKCQSVRRAGLGSPLSWMDGMGDSMARVQGCCWPGWTDHSIFEVR